MTGLDLHTQPFAATEVSGGGATGEVDTNVGSLLFL